MLGRIKVKDIGRVCPMLQWVGLRTMTKKARKSILPPGQLPQPLQIPKPYEPCPGKDSNTPAPLCSPPSYPQYPPVELQGCPPLCNPPRSCPFHCPPLCGCASGGFLFPNSGYCSQCHGQPPRFPCHCSQTCCSCECLSGHRPSNRLVNCCCPRCRSPPFNMTGPPPCCTLPPTYDGTPPCYGDMSYQYNPYANPWRPPNVKTPEQYLPEPAKLNLPEEHSPLEIKKQVQFRKPKSQQMNLDEKLISS